MSTKLTTRTYVRRLDKWLSDPITDLERADAEAWYVEAQRVAQKCADAMEVPLECGAGVVSAFSIRTRWKENVEDAVAYATGGKPRGGLRIRITLADAAVVQGFDAFKSPKTLNFAKACAGDTDAVVIDTWMLRASGLPAESAATPVQYRNISAAIRRLAKRHDMTPRGMQALIWGRIRGSLA